MYGSNDPEELIDQCALDLQRGLSDPFREEEFLVQSRGWELGYSSSWRTGLGIFARAKFRFPEDTVWMILRGFLEDCPKKNLFTKEVMAWKIFDLLSGRIERIPRSLPRSPDTSGRARKGTVTGLFGFAGRSPFFLIPT